MRIEQEVKLDFKDVLIKPNRSSLRSRSDVSLTRAFKFKHSGQTWSGIPIIASNMDGVGTVEVAKELQKHQMVTCITKQNSAKLTREDLATLAPHRYMYSIGLSYSDLETLDDYVNESWFNTSMLCIDVANGYTEAFIEFVQKVREEFPRMTIAAGNVVTPEITEELILRGVDIVKVGIGPGSVCTTRKMTGVGYPQLSAIMECAAAAHGLDGHIIADGGCTNSGDVAKAFAAGADFVMLGGMLAGHDEGGGNIIERKTKTNKINKYEIDSSGTLLINDYKVDTDKVIEFYGMSSTHAMEKHSGGVADYRASEGKTVEAPYRGKIENTVKEILGGLRSACTYVGAWQLKDLTKRTTFVRVTQQINNVFGES